MRIIEYIINSCKNFFLICLFIAGIGGIATYIEYGGIWNLIVGLIIAIIPIFKLFFRHKSIKSLMPQKTILCPICNQEVFGKNWGKYNGKSICMDCNEALEANDVDIACLDRFTLKEIKVKANIIKNDCYNDGIVLESQTPAERFCNLKDKQTNTLEKLKNQDSITNSDILNNLTVPNTIHILEDCCYLVETSNNIETVLSRLKLGIEKLDELEKIEKINNRSNSYNKYFIFFYSEREKNLKNAIARCFNKILKDVEKLKTDVAKTRHIEIFFNILKEHEKDIPYNVNEYINSLSSKYISMKEISYRGIVLPYPIKSSSWDKPDFEVNKLEKDFFDILYSKLSLEVNNTVTLIRLGDGTLSVECKYGYIGKIRLQGKKHYMQILINLDDSEIIYSNFINNIDLWIKYINDYLIDEYDYV